MPEWYINLLDNFPVPTFLKDRRGAILYANSLFFDLHDITPNEVMGRGYGTFMTNDMCDRVKQSDATLTEIGMTSEVALRFKRKNGQEIVVLAQKRLIELPDGSKAILGVVSDVSSFIQQERELREKHRLLRKQQGKLQRLATLDPLTGVFNRRAFFSKSAQSIETFRDNVTNIGLLMFDLDNFKQLNDRFGHAMGDKVLIDFTRLVMTCVRSNDVFARLGGEEFILLLPDTVTGSVIQVGERIRQLVEETPCRHDLGDDISYTTSVGGTMLYDTSDNINDAINRADIELYRAKRSGRNCLCFDHGADDYKKGVAKTA